MKDMRWIWITSIIISSIAFGLALNLPLFSIEPGAGRWTGVVKLLAAKEFEPSSVTLYGGIRSLWLENEILFAGLMAVFSVILPVMKLTVLWAEALALAPTSQSIWAIVRWCSKYAMLEVMMIALMLLLLKKLPGDSVVRIEAGTWFFTGSILLSLLASEFIKKNSHVSGPVETNRGRRSF